MVLVAVSQEAACSPSPCSGDEACEAAGAALTAAGDSAGALAAWERGCVVDAPDTLATSSASCTSLALRYAETPSPDPVRMRAVLGVGCSGTVALYDVCARLAGMAARGEGGPIDVALGAGAAASGCTREGAGRPQREVRAEACRILGVAARSGVGYPRQDRIADAAFADACALGLESACAEVPALSLALSPDGQWVATYHPLQPVRVWSLATGEVRFEYDGPMDLVVWSPDSSELRLVGILAWTEIPPQRPSLVVRTSDWSARPADPQLPLVYGWLPDGRLVWRDPDGTALKTTTLDGREETVWARPTSDVACDLDRCVARLQRGGADRSLVLASGGGTRWAPPFADWVVGSRVARIDMHEAFDLVAWRRFPITGPARDDVRYRGLFVGDAGAWTLHEDRVVPIDPTTLAPRGPGPQIPGLARCAPVHSNPRVCVWDGDRGRLVVQHGGTLQVVDLATGATIVLIDAI